MTTANGKSAPRPFMIARRASYQGGKILMRVATARTEEEAAERIAEERAAMRDTLGGLIAPGDDRQTYEVWKADWTLVREDKA